MRNIDLVEAKTSTKTRGCSFVSVLSVVLYYKVARVILFLDRISLKGSAQNLSVILFALLSRPGRPAKLGTVF